MGFKQSNRAKNQVDIDVMMLSWVNLKEIPLKMV